MSFLVLTTRLKKSYDIGPVLLPSRAIALLGNCRVWIRTSNPFKKPEILLQAAHDAWLKFENFTEEQVERILLEISKVGIANAELLAKLAAEETGYGTVEHKTLKNLFCAEDVYRTIRPMETIPLAIEVAYKHRRLKNRCF